MAILTSVAPASAFNLDAIRTSVQNFVARRKAYALAFNELSSLNDRELADIGINRTDIPAIARETADAA